MSLKKNFIALALLVVFSGTWFFGGSYAQLVDPQEADRLTNQVSELYRQGKYDEAIAFAQRALEIKVKALGPEHPDVASSRNNLAELHRVMGKYEEAEQLHKHSLATLEKALGDHPDVAISLNNLAELYRDMGNYTAAEPLHKRSLLIREKALGSENPAVATALNNISLLYSSMGNLEAAEPLYKRSLSIFEKALGPEHPDVAASLTNLAGLYKAMGNYAAAEPLYKRGLTLLEKVHGPEHPVVATSLNNLAELYRAMGNFTAAELFYNRSIAIKEKTFGSNHPAVAASLGNLALLYHMMENHVAAEPLYKRSLAILEKALGPDHPHVASNLNNIAALYRDMGNYKAAEPLCQRSLAIREKTLGPEHPAVATSLNNTALLYEAIRNHVAAEPLYQRSLKIIEKTLGPEHPDVAKILSYLSLFNASQGKNHHALYSMMRAQGIYERMIEQVSGFTSAERTMQFLTITGKNVDAIASLVGTRMKEDKTARIQAFEVWLRRKGVVLEAQRRMQLALIEAGDTQAAQVLEELSQTRSRLAQMTFAGPGKEGFEAYRKNLKELNDRREELDAKLSRLSQPYAAARKAGKVTVDELAQMLPAGTVMVDFARIEVFNFEAKGRDKKWMPAHYLAFVLKPGKGQDVALLDLGPAEEIDSVLEQFKLALTQRQSYEAQVIARRLHDAVFAPVAKELSGAERVFISPDGALNLIPFELLRDPEAKYLIEKYTFNYLAASRDLAGFGEKKSNAGKPLLLGDPDFDLNPKQRVQALDSVGARADSAANAARSADLWDMNFKRLPGTRAEVSAIGELLGRESCEVFLDGSALEEVLQSRKAPRFLHLATHGFFLKDQEVAAAPGFRGVVLDMDQPFARPAGPRMAVENPLLRCGLALAGANRTSSVEQGSDGILTADEVLSLPLRGTELVVLSACETGLGEVKKGEGVYGLRRVFTQAGARSLVMSMWSVTDRETQELMVEFYRNALSGKMDRCQALRQAALKQKEVVRQRYGQDHPFYWGAFVFLGQAD